MQHFHQILMFVDSKYFRETVLFYFREININSKDRFLLTSLSERNLGKSNYFPEARQNNVTDLSLGLELKAECYLETETFILKVGQKYN